MTDEQRRSMGVTPPPDGVLAGESVPRENEEEQIEDGKIEEVMGLLKARGEPWTNMSDSELRERSRKLINKHR